jgi:multidrug transporter EmrE-like cation transporter
MRSFPIQLFKSFVLGWGMVLLFVLFNSLGAFMIKTQVQKLGAFAFATPKSVFSYFYALFSSLKTWIGLMAVSLGTGAWILALANLELSKAYPVAVGLNLLVVVALAMLLFHEPLTFYKILGISLIFSGVIFLFQ